MTASVQAPPRRKLQELQTLYRLHPQFRDVIVEGRDDAALLTWFLNEHQVPHAKVFAVDDRVDVPAASVELVHPEINARGRVIAVASEVEGWNLVEPSATCVVDSDFDILDFTSRPSQSALLTTDYAAMEIYALEPRPLSKFLVGVAKSNVEASSVTSFLKPVWAVVYALRYVLHRETDGASLADSFAEACVDGVGQVISDVDALLRKVRPTPNAQLLAELLAIHKEYVARIPLEGLQGIRGHDVAPVLVRFLRLRNDLAQIHQIERLLRQSLELRDLDEQPMFQRLLERTTPI